MSMPIFKYRPVLDIVPLIPGQTAGLWYGRANTWRVERFTTFEKAQNWLEAMTSRYQYLLTKEESNA